MQSVFFSVAEAHTPFDHLTDNAHHFDLLPLCDCIENVRSIFKSHPWYPFCSFLLLHIHSSKSMIADSVEAAARTVKSPTPAKLRNMIDTIIARIRDDRQFDETNITIGELNVVADSFVKVVSGIHHHRISYPGYDFDSTGSTAAEAKAAPVAADGSPELEESISPELEQVRGN